MVFLLPSPDYTLKKGNLRMNGQQLLKIDEIKRRCYNEYDFYAEKVLKIRSEMGGIVPFAFNKVQKHLHFLVEKQLKEKGMVRVIILKGRQEGCSTYIEGRGFWFTSHRPGMQAFILAHEEKATNNLFKMAKRYYDNCDPMFQPSLKASNAKALIFGALDSGYSVGCARNPEVGRSSTIQFLHASEAAFYAKADEISKGLFEAVPDVPGTEVFIESTANGVGNWFHNMWQQAETGQSDYIPVFLPWFWKDGYTRTLPDDFVLTKEEQDLKNLYNLTDGQLAWRRLKIFKWSTDGHDGLKKFMQEYPCCAVEAFQMSGEDTFLDPNEVMKSRKETEAKEYGPLLIGVDPARFGDDRTAIIRRRGRVAFKLETYKKKDTMEIVGILYKIIKEENPARIYIDVGGLGAGIIDRLREMGYGKIIVPVNSATKAMNENKYNNKRSEMWALAKEWLNDRPSKIPDSDELHADLCNTKVKRWDSNNRLQMESKEEMKKRGVKSSDTADALLLTFAYPFNPESDNEYDQETSEIAARIFDPKRKKAKSRYTKRY